MFFMSSKLSLEKARSDLSGSKSSFNTKVIAHPEIGVAEFVTNKFIPLLQKFRDSKLFAEEHKRSINRMISSISTIRDTFNHASELGKEVSRDADVDLRNTIMENIDRIEGMLDSLAVPAGDQIISVTELTQEISVGETSSLDYEELQGSDGLYTVRKPPNDWIVREVNLEELAFENLAKGADPKLRKALGRVSTERNVLHFRSKKEMSARPIPGWYKLNGRAIPSALEIFMPVQFSVIPLERNQEPLFVERNIMHNTFLSLLSYLAIYELKNVKTGVYRGIKRYMIMELQQKLNNIYVAGNKIEELNHHVINVAFEGEVRDYLISITYPYIQGHSNEELKKEFRVLQSLIGSFHPLSFVNPEEKRREIQEKADKQFKEFMKTQGKEIFQNEFGLALIRVSGLSLDNSEALSKVIATLKPFEGMAKELKMNEDGLDILWGALREAEQGDSSELSKIIAGWVASLQEEENVQRQPN